MRAGARLDLIAGAIFCTGIGLYDVLYLVATFAGGPVIGPVNPVPFADFLVFYAAAQAYFEGKLALVYNLDAFTQYQNALFVPDRFPQPIQFRPFFYPPIWLLMLLPFGLIAVGKAYAAFMAATAAAATIFEGRREGWGWLAVLASPAAVWVILAGQNTFLSVALFYGGLRLLERAPAAAGILLGLLSYKPQLWVLVPVALLAARQWRVLAWMMGTVAVLSLASLAIFGADFWLAFIDATRLAATPAVADEMFERMHMQMTTLLAASRTIGLPAQGGAILQVGGAVLAVVAVWQAFRRHGPSDARTAILATAMFLVSPYTLNYDLLLLMPAAVMLFRQAVATGFLPLERLLYPALWLIPSVGWALSRQGLPITPLVILAFGAVAWARLQGTAKVELPAAADAR